MNNCTSVRVSKVDEAYIEEYVEYYNISFGEAAAKYFKEGPLSLEDNKYESERLEKYTNLMLTNRDGEIINALVTELEISKPEAINYYFDKLVPVIGRGNSKTPVLDLK